MDVRTFRERFPKLVHFAPRAHLRLQDGLLTAAQILDRAADATGRVRVRFLGEQIAETVHKDFYKTHSRFRRGLGERGCNMLVESAHEASVHWFLGNNWPLGAATRLGEVLDGMTPAEWFATLNNMFWVFAHTQINTGFVNHVQQAAQPGRVARMTILTDQLPDRIIEERVRLSSINGGGSNGWLHRGHDTYKTTAEWPHDAGRPKEIAICGGLHADEVAALVEKGALTVEDL